MTLKYPWEEDRSSNGRAWCCHGFRLYQFFGQTSDTQEDRAVVYLMTSASVPWTSTGPTPLGELTAPYLTGRPIGPTETIEDLLSWADEQLDTLLPVGWVAVAGRNVVRFDGGDGRTVLGLEPDFGGRRGWIAGEGAKVSPDEWWERRYPVVPRLLVLLLETAKWGNRLAVDVGVSAGEPAGESAPDAAAQIEPAPQADPPDTDPDTDADAVLATALITHVGTQLGYDGPIRTAFVALVNAALEQGTLKLAWTGSEDPVGGAP